MRIGIVGTDAEEIATTVRSVASTLGVFSEQEVLVLSEREAAENGVIEDADVYVTIGEAGLLSLVRAGVRTPVLPVAAGRSVGSVSRNDLDRAVETILTGEFRTIDLDTIAVSADDQQYRALMDVTAVSNEAAKISEYQVLGRLDDEAVVVDRVRSDGVVASTPAGTPGYGTSAGGPILEPGLRAVSVVAVSPFRVEQPHWVLRLPIRFEVVREEVPVSLIVDDRSVQVIDEEIPVTLEWGTPFQVVHTAVSPRMLGNIDENSSNGRL